MYICTVTRQKIGDLSRCVSTYQKRASVKAAAHASVRTTIASFNGNYDIGTEELVSVNELNDGHTDGDLTANPTLKGSVIICTTNNNAYRYSCIDISGVTLSNLATEIRNLYLALTGIDLLTPTSKNVCYITNVVLYMYEEEEDV